MDVEIEMKLLNESFGAARGELINDKLHCHGNELQIQSILDCSINMY